MLEIVSKRKKETNLIAAVSFLFILFLSIDRKRQLLSMKNFCS